MTHEELSEHSWQVILLLQQRLGSPMPKDDVLLVLKTIENAIKRKTAEVREKANTP